MFLDKELDVICLLQAELKHSEPLLYKSNSFCKKDAMTPEIDIRRIKNPRDVKEVLSKTIEACRKANGIRTSEIIGDHGHFPEPAPHGMPPEPCHEHPHN